MEIDIQKPNGEIGRYRLTVFRVETRYEDGTPEDVVRIKPDMTCELNPDDSSKNEFIIGFMPAEVLENED